MIELSRRWSKIDHVQFSKSIFETKNKLNLHKNISFIRISKANRRHALRQGKILFVSREIVYFMTFIAK